MYFLDDWFILVCCVILFVFLIFIIKDFIGAENAVRKRADNRIFLQQAEAFRDFVWLILIGIALFSFYFLFAKVEALGDPDYEDFLLRLLLLMIVLPFCIPILCALIMWGYNWRIELLEEEIIYRNVWRRSKRYRYVDIKMDYSGSYEVYYSKGKKIFSLSSWVINNKKFSKELKQAYARANMPKEEIYQNFGNFVTMPKKLLVLIQVLLDTFVLIVCLSVVFLTDYKLEKNFLLAKKICFSAIAFMAVVSYFVISWALVWRIEVKENTYVFRNMFFIKREYKFEDLTYRDVSNGVVLYNKGKRVTYCMLTARNIGLLFSKL